MRDLGDEPRITIDGVDGIFILLSDGKRDPSGAVTTQEDFDNFVPGFGHMIAGTIWRYGKEICGKDGWRFVQDPTPTSKAKKQ